MKNGTSASIQSCSRGVACDAARACSIASQPCFQQLGWKRRRERVGTLTDRQAPVRHRARRLLIGHRLKGLLGLRIEEGMQHRDGAIEGLLRSRAAGDLEMDGAEPSAVGKARVLILRLDRCAQQCRASARHQRRLSQPSLQTSLQSVTGRSRDIRRASALSVVSYSLIVAPAPVLTSMMSRSATGRSAPVRGCSRADRWRRSFRWKAMRRQWPGR